MSIVNTIEKNDSTLDPFESLNVANNSKARELMCIRIIEASTGLLLRGAHLIHEGNLGIPCELLEILAYFPTDFFFF